MLFIIVIVLVIICAVVVYAVITTKKRNKAIMENGIETNAMITRVDVSTSTDDDGFVTRDYTYYVTLPTPDGRTAEAKLGSGKAVNVMVGGKSWDSDLREGITVRVRYQPDRPDYAILVTE